MDIYRQIFLIVVIAFIKPGQTHQCSEHVAGGDYIEIFTSLGESTWDEPWRNYNNNYYECWLISSELGGKVELTFDFFQLQPPENGVCTSDWLKVYDGEEERAEDLMSTYCGSHNGTKVTSSGTKMLVIFSTDESITDIGFRIFFMSVDVDMTPGSKTLGIALTVGIIIIALVVVAAVVIVVVVLCVCTKKTNKKSDVGRKAAIAPNLYDQDMSPAVVIVAPLPAKT